MDSVPVWVLTAVIEISLLGTGALGLVVPCSGGVSSVSGARCGNCRKPWHTRRQWLCLCPRHTLREPRRHCRTIRRRWRKTTLPRSCRQRKRLSPRLQSHRDQQPLSTLVRQQPEIAPGPEEVVTIAPPAPEPLQEAEISGVLTQNMLDALLASGSEDASPENTQEQGSEVSEAAQSVATMFAEHATMEQQIQHMQEKNGQLRQTIEVLIANGTLPLEDQQELKVPEQTMQEIEEGLAALQHTRQRMLQQLQAHCQVLGIDDPGQRSVGALGDDGAAVPVHEERTSTIHLQEEVHHLTNRPGAAGRGFSARAGGI